MSVTDVEYETATLSINVTDVDSSLNWKVNVVFKTDAYEHPHKNAGPTHTVSQGQESYSFDYDAQGSTVTADVYLNWLIPASDYTVEVKLCDTDCGSRNVKAEASTTFSTNSGCTPHPTNRGRWFPGYHFTKVTENELTVRVHVNSSYAPLNSGRCVYYTYNTYFEHDDSEILTAYIRHIGSGGRTAQIELTDLEPGTRYGYHITLDVEAEDNAAGFSGSTLGPNTGISEIEFTDITNDSAKATATIKNASTDDKFVYWRYRESPLDGDPGIWLTLDKVSTKTATADKDLSYLEAGTRYEVEASVKDNFNLGMSMTRVFVTLPGKPGISPLEPGDGSLKVTWTAPDDGVATITGYTVKWQESEEYFTSEFPPPTTTLSTYDADADDTSYTITGLTNGTEYRVHVIAKNESGGTESNGEFGTPMGIPNAPNSLQVAPGNEKLTLTWDEPTTKVGVTVNGYKVQWKEDSVADWDAQTGVTEVSVGANVLTHEITGLTNGTTYDVRVRADNGITSDTYNWETDDGTPRSDPIVTDVTVPDSTKTQTSAIATVDIDNQTGESQTVHLRYRKNTESGWTVETPKTVASTDTSMDFDLRPLIGNTTYVVEAWLAATEDTKESDEFTTTPVEPNPPINVRVTGTADKAITIAWDAPSDGGSPITGYKVQWKLNSQANWDTYTEKEDPDDQSPYTITENLENGERYDIRVIAVNDVDDSDPSAAVEGMPSKKPDPPTDVEVSAHGDGWLEVTWTEPEDKGGLPTTYIVQWKPDGEQYNEQSRQHTPATSPHEITNLDNGTEYTVRVLANNDRGTSDDPGDGTNEDTGTPMTKPQPPTGVTITGFGNESLTVSWTAPTDEDTGGSAITGYKVQWKEETTPNWDSPSEESDDASPYTIETLANGTKYDVRVIAVNINGDSRESDSATGTPSRKPDAPTGVDITDYGNGWLEVTWNAVTGTDTGGSDIKNYIVQWKSGANYDTTNQATPPPTESPYRITSLENGTEYTVRVLAVNETYPKDPSDDPGDGTNEDKETPRTKPKPPTGVNISEYGDGYLKVAWTAPEDNGGSALVSFKVQWEESSVSGWDSPDEKTVTAVSGKTDYETTISSLANGTRYTVRVLAVNGNRAIDNTSDTSNTASGTPSTMPRAPKSVTITNKGDRTLTVTWEPPDKRRLGDYQLQGAVEGRRMTLSGHRRRTKGRKRPFACNQGLTNGVVHGAGVCKKRTWATATNMAR